MAKILLQLTLLLAVNFAASQVTGRIVDSKTGESIPYANIRSGDENLISNEEGWFTLAEANSGDESQIAISYLGYVARQLSVSELKQMGNTIKLEMGIVELDNVNVSNEKPDADKIIAMVKSNLKKNYSNDGKAVKNTIFYRQSKFMKPSVLDVEIDKSTGFSSNQLRDTNSKLDKYFSSVITHPPLEYTDILCDYYRGTIEKAGKPEALAKLNVVKAVKLKNEDRSADMDELQKKTTDIIMQHLDSTKYYRIKSGLFGSRDTVSLRKDFNRKKKPKDLNLARSKGEIMNFMVDNSLLHTSKLDFLKESDDYEFTYEGATYNGDQDFVYIIGFKPHKSRAKFEGKLYVSDADYAVLRADYELGEGKKVSGVNLKLLLGVKFSENYRKGTLIYRRNQVGEGYYLQYALEESGQYFYLNRPLKFIELTEKSEEDVVKFELEVEANTRDKTEFLNLSRTETTADAISAFKESDFKFLSMKAYDPKIWKDHSAIEPVEAMKQFRAVN